MDTDLVLIFRSFMNSFKFWYKTKHDEEKYNKLCVDYANNATIKKCDKLKGIASSYFVESLDILLTYHYIFKLVVPILFLFLAMIFHHHSTMLLTLIVLTPVSFCATYYVRRKYKLMRNRYYFEIQGLYFCLNEKYKMNKRVTNEELGRHFM